MASQDMMDLEGLLGNASQPVTTIPTEGGEQQRILPTHPVGVDLAKHPSGIVPTLQYTKITNKISLLTLFAEILSPPSTWNVDLT
jgi:hypothetical protein